MKHTGKRALVLAGGGAKGSYQIGVWRALQALDWTPDIITGASVGTLNGCLFTMGKIQEAEDLWRGLEIHDVLEIPETLKPDELRPFFLDIIRSGGLNVEPLTETIDRLIDEDAVRTSPIHFGLVMTELGSRERTCLGHRGNTPMRIRIAAECRLDISLCNRFDIHYNLSLIHI